MGSLLCCCKNSNEEADENRNIAQVSSRQPTDREKLRQLQAEAAERRMKENESRGIKNPEHVRQQQAKRDQLEELERNANRNNGGEGLRWQVG